MKLISGILVAAVFAVMTFGLWAYMNRPESEPPWPKQIQGVAFSPFAADQDPFGSKDVPPIEQIDADLKLLRNWRRSTTSAWHWAYSSEKMKPRTNRK